MANTNGHKMGQGRANVLLGMILVGLGALFLVSQLFDLDLGAYFWPFLIIAPGLMFFVGMVLGGKAFGPLAIPGSIVTMTGLVLLYQNTFDHWESWAYAWALIMPTSIGIGLLIYGAWIDNQALVNRGLRVAGVGLAIFVVAGAFFELILDISDISDSFAGAIVWPGLLILAGLYLLRRRDQAPPNQTDSSQPAPKAEAPARPIQVETDQPPKPTEFEPLDMTRTRKKKASDK